MNNTQHWQQLTLSVDKINASRIADGLTSLGALATSFAAKTPQNYIQHQVGEIDFIGMLEVSALFDAEFDRRIIDLLLDQDLKDNWQILSAGAWQNKWKEGLAPINFNNRLSVVPSWQPATNDGNIQLKLDAGAAFGTGSHATTYLCLEWLTTHLHGSKSVIDFGCGSGILGIAAGLLGASRVIMTDCDPLALTTTIENAALNNVVVETYLPQEMPKITVDLVLANILASTLKELYPLLLEHVKIGGIIVLSGILNEQAAAIEQLYGQSFELQICTRDEWVLIFGKRIK